MKVLAFTDLHSSEPALKKIKNKLKKHKPDYILCAGDTAYGREHGKTLKKINALKTPVILLPGNPPHETITEVRKQCRKYKNIRFAHKKIIDLDGYKLIGHGGGGFYDREELDEDFEKFVKKNKTKLKGQNIILLTHAPPYKTKLDYLDWFKEHVGCASYKNFIKKYKPVLAISGHIHETFGKKQKIGKTLLYNPGPQGMVFRLTKKKVEKIR